MPGRIARIYGAPMPEVPRTWLREAKRIDLALYAAIAATPTPVLDRGMSTVSRAADHSRLWLSAAAILAISRGPSGRRAAGAGLASVAATSALVNAVLKPIGGRRRPDPEQVPLARQIRMPRSTSFPSGHAASAFAFATSIGRVLPREAMALQAFAAVVAYSRVHTGVHYPADVVTGSLVGVAVAQLTGHRLERRFTRPA
jgi:membrane-associated phospholipid phosphatase